MSKHIYCANCGTELILIHKALPKQQKTIMVIPPHVCPEEHPEFPFKDINNELITRPDSNKSETLKGLDKLKFVKNINDMGKSENTLTVEPPPETGDKRPKEDLFKDIIPTGIKKQLNKGE